MNWAQRHHLPQLGVGVGLRREFYDSLFVSARAPDWLELTPENFLTFGGRPRRVLDAARERFRISSHGVGLNLGGPDALDEAYLHGLQRLTGEVSAPFFSDHLSYSRLGGVYLHDLLPLPFSEAVVEHVVPRIRLASERVGLPFALENPSYYARMPGETLDEAAFLSAVLEGADCGLLLDVNNVYVNAQNHGYDPREFISRLPLERVVQIHLAGHLRTEALIIDTHGDRVCDEVWALYRYTLERTGPVSTLIEWDQDIPSLDAVLDEADRARAILTSVTERPE